MSRVLQLDVSLGGDVRPAPLTTSRYPPSAERQKAFHYHQKEQFRAAQRASLIQYSKANHLHLDQEALDALQPPPPPPSQHLFSPSVSPSHSLAPAAPGTPRSLLANTAAHTLALALQPRSHRTSDDPLPFPSFPSSSSSSPSPFTSLSTSHPSLPPRPPRMPSFHLDKFLTSHQHLSTLTERLHVTAVLKKDARVRSPHEVESMGKFLQTIDAFSGLELPVCVDLARHCRLRKYNREEVIYREGDDATSFYVIMTGAVGTRMNPQLLRGRMEEEEKGGGGGMAALVLPASDEGYIAGVEYAGSSLGSDSFSSSLLPRHSSTRMAIERCELLVLDMSDYATTMRMHRREEEKQRMHVLKHIKAFELCNAEELWHIAQHMQHTRVSKNQLVFTQGEHADRLYFVQTGECRAVYTTPTQPSNPSSSSTPAPTSFPSPPLPSSSSSPSSSPMYLDLGRLRQYSFFGELAMFTPLPLRSCTVYADTSACLYSITYDDFRAKAPRFVVEAMKEWGATLYAKEGGGELERMMRQEERWIRWKGRMMEAVRPQEVLRKEAARSGKGEGRQQMRFR